MNFTLDPSALHAPPLFVKHAKSHSLSFQQVAHSSQFYFSCIPIIFCSLRTLCQKHPGVGVPSSSLISSHFRLCWRQRSRNLTKSIRCASMATSTLSRSLTPRRVPSYRPQVLYKCNSRPIDSRTPQAQSSKCNREFGSAGGGKHGYHLFAPVRRIAACERSRPVGSAGLSFRLRPSNPPRPSGRNPHRPLTLLRLTPAHNPSFAPRDAGWYRRADPRDRCVCEDSHHRYC